MADILYCSYSLPGRATGHRECVATGLGDVRGRYRLTPAGRLWRILPQDPKAHEPYPLTGVVRLRPKGRRTSIEFLLTFISGEVQAVQTLPVMVPAKHAKALKVLAREERALRRVIDQRTQKLFAQLKTVDPEIALHAILVFGNHDGAATWLSRPHPLLGSRSPFNLLATGRRQAVFKALNAILYGLPV